MTSLADKVARVKELDAKRTQGVITTDRDKQRPLITTPYDGHHCFTPDDVAYYNHAPQMAALITQLWDELEHLKALKMTADAVMEYEVIKKQREALKLAREALLENNPRISATQIDALTAIDNVMNK